MTPKQSNLISYRLQDVRDAIQEHYGSAHMNLAYTLLGMKDLHPVLSSDLCSSIIEVSKRVGSEISERDKKWHTERIVKMIDEYILSGKEILVDDSDLAEDIIASVRSRIKNKYSWSIKRVPPTAHNESKQRILQFTKYESYKEV